MYASIEPVSEVVLNKRKSYYSPQTPHLFYDFNFGTTTESRNFIAYLPNFCCSSAHHCSEFGVDIMSFRQVGRGESLTSYPTQYRDRMSQYLSNIFSLSVVDLDGGRAGSAPSFGWRTDAVTHSHFR